MNGQMNGWMAKEADRYERERERERDETFFKDRYG